MSTTVRRVHADVSAGKEEVREDLRELASSIRERYVQKRDKMRHEIALANKTTDSPYFHDIGTIFDSTFVQPPLSSSQFVLSSPNLLPLDGTSLFLTTVHQSNPDVSDQLQHSFKMIRTCGEKLVTKKPMSGQFEWKRPVQLTFSSYGALPMRADVDPTMRIGATFTDVWSKTEMDLTTRMTGVDYMHSLKLRLPYATNVIAAMRSNEQAAGSRILSGSLSKLLLREADGKTFVAGGVEVESAPFTEKDGPQRVGALTTKIEYNEPSMTIDTTVRASNYRGVGGQDSFKLSHASVRGIYASHLGRYPCWSSGIMLGLEDGTSPSMSVGGGVAAGGATGTSGGASRFSPFDDPDWSHKLLDRANTSVASKLDTPVITTAFNYKLNKNNTFKVLASSRREVTGSFIYNLTPNISFRAALNAWLPSWDVFGLGGGSSAGSSFGQIRTGLALGVDIIAS